MPGDADEGRRFLSESALAGLLPLGGESRLVVFPPSVASRLVFPLLESGEPLRDLNVKTSRFEASQRARPWRPRRV